MIASVRRNRDKVGDRDRERKRVIIIYLGLKNLQYIIFIILQLITPVKGEVMTVLTPIFYLICDTVTFCIFNKQRNTQYKIKMSTVIRFTCVYERVGLFFI